MRSAENRANVPQTNDGRYVDVLAKRWVALRQVLRCRRGASALEFALVAVPLLTLIIGIFEVCWQLTTGAMLDNVVLRASRFGVTGQTNLPGSSQFTCRSATINWIITNSAGGFLKLANLTVSITTDGSASGLGGGTPVAGAGDGGQVVTYNVTYAQTALTGAWLNFGGWGSLVHRTSLVVKNEPFDNVPC
jgi:Flp pilus assembly protein TadG